MKKVLKWVLIVIGCIAMIEVLGEGCISCSERKGNKEIQECLKNNDFQKAHDLLRTKSFSNDVKKQVYIDEIKYLVDQNTDASWLKAVTLIQEYKSDASGAHNQLEDKLELSNLLLDYALTFDNKETCERLSSIIDGIISEAKAERKADKYHKEKYDVVVDKANTMKIKCGVSQSVSVDTQHFIWPQTTSITQCFQVVNHEKGYIFVNGNDDDNDDVNLSVEIKRIKAKKKDDDNVYYLTLYLMDDNGTVYYTKEQSAYDINKLGVGESMYVTFSFYDVSNIEKVTKFKIVKS